MYALREGREYLTDEALIAAVVGWWSAHLRGGARDWPALSRQATQTVGIIDRARTRAVPEEKVALFEQALERGLRDPGEHRRTFGMWRYPRYFELITDYQPQTAILDDALRVANIMWIRLPLKTTMEIRDGVVRITQGEDAGQQIYPLVPEAP